MKSIYQALLIFVYCVGAPHILKAMTLDGAATTNAERIAAEPETKEPSKSLLGERLSIKVGYKLWVARWQTTANPVANTSANTGPGGLNQITSTDSVMSGPSGSVRLKLRDSPWFNSLIGSLTFLNGGFNFQEIGNAEELGLRSLSKQDATRKDYTATLGISIYESVGIFAGYYWTEQSFTVRNTLSGPLLLQGAFSSTFHARRELQGPIFGLYGSAPIGERVSFYGNIAYALLKFRSDQGVTQGTNFGPGSGGLNSDAVQGWAAEVGGSIRGPSFWKINTDLQIGFRAQMILKSFGENAPSPNRISGSFGNDVTWGPTFTISAIF